MSTGQVIISTTATTEETLSTAITTTTSTSVTIANSHSTAVALSIPPSAQLQKVHEEKESVDVAVEPSTAISSSANRDSKPDFDETNWPSLSAASRSATKSSSVWGNRSGTERVRQAASTASIGAVGDRPLHSANSVGAALNSHSNQNHSHGAIKPAGIITAVVELSSTELTKKREFGNKTTTPDIVRRVKDKKNIQIDISTSTASGTTTFFIKGNPEDVSRAKRELLSHLTAKTEERFKIPQSVRRFILGPRGETLKSITNRTNTRIQLPPRQNEVHEDRSSEADFDEEELMQITIEGDREGVALAKAEITAIVNEKNSKKSVKVTDIEHHFYPLIAGAHNRRLQELQQETGAKIHIPPYIASFDSEGHEVNSRDNYIMVSGDREAVKKAVEKLRARHEELKVTTSVTQTTVSKRQHKYLIGPKGANLQEILENTECSLELSPPSDPSETVIIRGPPLNHWKAMQAVSEKASSIHVETMDIAGFHKADNQLEHAKNVLKYLWNRSKLRKIETDTGIQIMVPKGTVLDKGVILEFFGKDAGAVEKARKEVSEIVRNLPPTSFTVASIEPHLHRHIIGRKGQNLQRVKETYGVEIIVPDEKDESPDILIVFEGREDAQIPLETRNIKDVLEKAKQELIKAGQDASDFATETLTIPVRFHRHIIGPRGTTLNNITGGSEAPVSVKFGSSRTGAAERSANAEGKRATTIPVSDDIVVIKGPTEEVNRVVKEINRVVEDAKHIEVMNSYTIEFVFPAQYSAHVIGKGGAHVTRLKDNLNVKIDIEGGAKGEEKKTHPGEDVKVTIQGRKDNVEEAKLKILDLVDKLQDATILRLNIPAEYHKSLIGVGGRYVKRLEEKYGVHIRFPKNNKDVSEEDIDSQKPDEVIIKGGRRGAGEAKDELMELYEYEREHDNSLTFTIPAAYLPHVVGRGGSKITEIKDDTFTRIDIERHESSPDDSDDSVVNVVVHGTKGDITKAQEAILQIVRELESQTTITVNIDPQHHKFLIGPGGSRIREIVARAGGPEERASQAGIVKFPRNGSNSSEVILKGDKELVERVKAELERLVDEQNNLIMDVIQIPRIQHPQIIGRSGTSLKDLQHRFNVEIQFPGSRGYHHTQWPSNLTEEIQNSEEAVKIIGKKEDIEAAKLEIMSKIRHITSISIPRKYHCTIAANCMRKLRQDYGVLVDHGSDIPPEPKPPKRKQSDNGVTKRIDSEYNETIDDFNTELEYEIEENDDSEEEGEIIWNLKGDIKQVERAEKYINDLLNEARTYTHTAYITVPQLLHRRIIGRGGATIQRIRSESDCRIDVPKGTDDEVVVVTGSLEGVEKAKNLMQEVIERVMSYNKAE